MSLCVCVCVGVCVPVVLRVWGQESQPCGFDWRQSSLSKHHRVSLRCWLTSLLEQVSACVRAWGRVRSSSSILPFHALLSFIPKNGIHRIQWKTPSLSDAVRHRLCSAGGCSWAQLPGLSAPPSALRFSPGKGGSLPGLRTHSSLPSHLSLMCPPPQSGTVWRLPVRAPRAGLFGRGPHPS